MQEKGEINLFRDMLVNYRCLQNNDIIKFLLICSSM